MEKIAVKENAPVLSIIICAHDQTDCLRNCVASLFVRPCENAEYLLVDDGSAPEGAQICRQLTKEYPSLQLLRKSNGGVASARNYGLAHAKGIYIAFVDGDDQIEAGIYQTALDAARPTVDAVFFGLSYQLKGELLGNADELPEGHIYGEALRQFWLRLLGPGRDGTLPLHASVCRAIYRRSIIEGMVQPFACLRFSEDLLFNLNFLIQAHEVVTLSSPGYRYIVHESSVTNRYTPNRLEQIEKALDQLHNFCEQSNVPKEQWEPRLQGWFLGQLSVCARQVIEHEPRRIAVQRFQSWRQEKTIQWALRRRGKLSPGTLTLFKILFTARQDILLYDLVKMYRAFQKNQNHKKEIFL